MRREALPEKARIGASSTKSRARRHARRPTKSKCRPTKSNEDACPQLHKSGTPCVGPCMCVTPPVHHASNILDLGGRSSLLSPSRARAPRAGIGKEEVLERGLVIGAVRPGAGRTGGGPGARLRYAVRVNAAVVSRRAPASAGGVRPQPLSDDALARGMLERDHLK